MRKLVCALALWACDEGGGDGAEDAKSGEDAALGAGGAGGGGGAAGGGGAGGDCLASAFLAVDGTQAAGAGYPATRLSASCTDGRLVVESNGSPHYAFIQTTPHDLAAQQWRFELPLDPEPAAEPTDLPYPGMVGIAINGVPIYSPSEAERPDPFGDPVANAILDACLGHTAERGDYHYHALLEACLREAEGASAILGFGFDGFPIYGPRGCADSDCSEVVEFRSGYEYIDAGGPCTSAADCAADEACNREIIGGEVQQVCVSKTYSADHHRYVGGGDDVLDECNGRVGPDGTYRYHTTATWPYVMGCFRGRAPAMMGPPDGMDELPEDMPDEMPGTPPPEAVAACEGQAAGDACTLVGRMGETIQGTCQDIAGTLACVRAGGPPR